MCDKAVDGFLPTLIFVPDWFVITKMIKKINSNLFSIYNTIFVNEVSNNVTFLVMKWVS